MKYLIDGLNLVYKFPELEGLMYEDRLNDARDGLVNILADFARRGQDEEIIVFFDGRKNSDDWTPEEFVKKVQIYYSLEDSADEVIMGFIRQYDKLSELRLVTSDKEILSFARQFRVNYTKSEAFAEEIIKRLDEIQDEPADEDEKETDLKLSSGQVSFWERIFRA